MIKLKWKEKRNHKQIINDLKNGLIPERNGFVIKFNEHFKVLDIKYGNLNKLYSQSTQKSFRYTTYVEYEQDNKVDEIIKYLRLCSYENDKYEDAIEKVEFPCEIKKEFFRRYEEFSDAKNEFEKIKDRIDKNGLKNKVSVKIIENVELKYFGILVTTFVHLDREFLIAEKINIDNFGKRIRWEYKVVENYSYGKIQEFHI
ncbi:MAG TPA: hypothetical protein VK982_05475 [Bacteroidales bacterium]|nr:hypothetical protein [Bacteroidales bacterium]